VIADTMQQKKVVIVQPTSNGRFTIIPQPEEQQGTVVIARNFAEMC
jgi:hypothetical protein